MKWIAAVGVLVLLIASGMYMYQDRNEPKRAVQQASVLPVGEQELIVEERTLQEYLLPVPPQLIIINRSANQLAFFENGKLVKVYTISTGKRSTPTPAGTFPIVNKIKNRPFYKFNIPGGDPRNPLGNRWLGLDIDGTNGTTYAIHGNSNSATIGYHVSNGCIRMYNEDVRSLFEQVNVGTMVIVQDFDTSWTEVALQHGYKVYG